MTVAEFLVLRVKDDLDAMGDDPRLNAEVKTKYALLMYCRYFLERAEDDEYCEGYGACLSDVLRAVSCVYRSHPDFNPEWDFEYA